MHLVGVLTDREVAERAGVTPDGVRMYRHRHGIPASNGRSRSASPSASTNPLSAYAVGVKTEAGNAEYVVVSRDIVSAASQALRLLGNRGQAAQVTSIEYLAETLNTGSSTS